MGELGRLINERIQTQIKQFPLNQTCGMSTHSPSNGFVSLLIPQGGDRTATQTPIIMQNAPLSNDSGIHGVYWALGPSYKGKLVADVVYFGGVPVVVGTRSLIGVDLTRNVPRGDPKDAEKSGQQILSNAATTVFKTIDQWKEEGLKKLQSFLGVKPQQIVPLKKNK